MYHFQLKSPAEMPVHPLLHSDLWLENKEKRRNTLDNVAKDRLSYMYIFAHHNLEDDNEGEKDMQWRFCRRGCCIWCLVIAYKVMEKGHCIVGDTSCLS